MILVFRIKTAAESQTDSAAQLVDKVLYGELLCNSHRGALCRRAPLSEKRSTGSFYQIHPCGAPNVWGSFALCEARPKALPLETASL